MKTNEGKIDRTLRVAVGVGLLSLVFVGPQTMCKLVPLSVDGAKLAFTRWV